VPNLKVDGQWRVGSAGLDDDGEVAEGAQARVHRRVLIAGDLGQDRAGTLIDGLAGQGQEAVAISIDAELDDQLDPRLCGRGREGCFRFQRDSAIVMSHVQR